MMKMKKSELIIIPNNIIKTIYEIFSWTMNVKTNKIVKKQHP